MKFCKNCGQQLAAEAKFCAGCGAKEDAAPAPQAPYGAAPPPPGAAYPPPAQAYPPPAQAYPPPGAAYPPPAQAYPPPYRAPGRGGGPKPLLVAGALLGALAIAFAVWFFVLRDATGLVGEWEHREEDRWGETEIVTFQFNRDGTGRATYRWEWDGGSESESFRFEWEVARADRLEITFFEGRDSYTEAAYFRIRGRQLELDIEGDFFVLDRVR